MFTRLTGVQSAPWPNTNSAMPLLESERFNAFKIAKETVAKFILELIQLAPKNYRKFNFRIKI